jgi:hypothetical protein
MSLMSEFEVAICQTPHVVLRHKIKKGVQMNSIHENRNSLETREQLLARLGDAICSECRYLAIHQTWCSKSHAN